MAGARKILVVDDDPVIVKLLQVNFEMEGYDVVTAVDGQDGLERARDAAPDAIVSDVMMPRMDGIELAKELKADASLSKIPIVLLSAKAQTADVQLGLGVADDYVTKPFDPLELLERVAGLIGE